jgi:hypothetical protein
MSENANVDAQAAWEPVTLPAPPEEDKPLTRGEKVQQMIDVVDSSMGEIYTGTFDHNRAEKVAAAAWSAQFGLSTFLPDAKLRAKQAKNLLKLVKAQADKKYRDSNGEKRRTEAQIEQLVTSDPEVVAAEAALLAAEHEAEKWECVLSSIKDGHIFFRNLNKT